MSGFFDESYRSYIYTYAIRALFPRLDVKEAEQLADYTLKLLNRIAIRLYFDHNQRDAYVSKLYENNHLDLKSLVLLLLPYIDNTQNQRSRIENLRHLVTAREDGSLDHKEVEYLFSNYQYGRFDRRRGRETVFSTDQLRQNFELLLETIDAMAHKLMVNWLDVRPITLDEEVDLITTQQKLLSRSGWQVNNPLDEASPGISLSDVYETVVNTLYREVKPHKWLLYLIVVDDVPWPIIHLLKLLFQVDRPLNGVRWVDLDDEQRSEFDRQWARCLEAAKINRSIGRLSSETICDILTDLVLFYDRYYPHLQTSEYRVQRKSVDLPLVDDDDEHLEVDYSTIAPLLAKISSEQFYRFIHQEFARFGRTWYGHRMTRRKNGRILLPDSVEEMRYMTEKSSLISFKNLYNFGQSLVTRRFDRSAKNRKNILFGYYWRNLTSVDRTEIARRINSSNPSEVLSWFNLSGYIRRIDDTADFAGRNFDIFTVIKSHLLPLTAEILRFRGSFSRLVPAPELTDKRNFTGTFNEKTAQRTNYLKRQIFKDRARWKNCYHFLPRKPYSELGPYRRNVGSKVVEEDYFTFVSRHGWVGFYAMNWVSQIAFFHRYLHSRVIFVTGATGVGKSSQIPKLLLYAEMILDHKSDGKVACTIPRITPVIQVAERVSFELGVPIEYTDPTGKKNRLNDYFIEYQYSEGAHMTTRSGPRVRFLTDGILLEDLKTSPLLKEQSRDKLLLDNKYEAVIVDESHEHNANMDTILTLMRYALYYNNSIKLLIVSATMDSDEHSYRRFFRDINNNRIFPLNRTLSERRLDRVNIEQRLHISEPEATTQYRITEYERPDLDPIGAVRQILSESPMANILIFQPGERECREMVSQLNSIIPINIIAVPFYSKMSSDARPLVENIDSRLSQIRVPRDRVYGYDRDWTPVSHTYTQFIVVATNIAEASLTINRLTHVVDDGKQKIGVYNPTLGASEIVLKPISQSSRLQRKGRVGRVGPGTVYYTYDISTCPKQTYFDICLSDISDLLLSLLGDSTEIEIDPESDPNNPAKFAEIGRKWTELYRPGIREMIREQYFDGDSVFSYYGDDEQYDYSETVAPPVRRVDGYQLDQLLDPHGRFHIVHPEEIYIGRNLLGFIITQCEEKKCRKVGPDGVASKKMTQMVHRLRGYQLLEGDRRTDFGRQMISLGVDVNKLHPMGVTMNQKLLFLWGQRYGIEDQVFTLMAAQQATNGAIRNLYRKKEVIVRDRKLTHQEFKLARSLFKIRDSDLRGILEIVDRCRSDHRQLFKLDSEAEKKKRVEFAADKKTYLHERLIGKGFTLPGDRLSKLQLLDSLELLKNSPTVDDAEWEEAKKRGYDQSKSSNKIPLEQLKRWADDRGLDGDTFAKMIDRYRSISRTGEKLIKTLDSGTEKRKRGEFAADKKIYLAERRNDRGFSLPDERLSVFQLLDSLKLLKDSSTVSNAEWEEARKHRYYAEISVIEDRSNPLTDALLRSYGYQIAIRMPGTTSYVLLNQPELKHTVSLAPIHPRMPNLESLIAVSPHADLLLYLSHDPTKNLISFIHHLTPTEFHSGTEELYTDEIIDSIRKQVEKGKSYLLEDIRDKSTERQQHLTTHRIISGHGRALETIEAMFEKYRLK